MISTTWHLKKDGDQFIATGRRAGRDDAGRPVDEETGIVLKAETVEKLQAGLERRGCRILRYCSPGWDGQTQDVFEVWLGPDHEHEP